MLGVSCAHPLEPGEAGVEGECVAVPGTGVSAGAEPCCRPAVGALPSPSRKARNDS